MIHENPQCRAVLIEFEHSSGASASKILATEPGIYRLFAKTSEKVDSAIVLVGPDNEVLEQSPGSRLRFITEIAVGPFAALADAGVVGATTAILAAA